MDDSFPLADRFLAQLGNTNAALRPELERAIGEIVAAARQRFPGVQIEPLAVARHLAERGPAGTDLVHSLPELRGVELVLTGACPSAHPTAMAAVETSFMPVARAGLTRIDPSGRLSEDALQIVRGKLFVGDGGPPKIAAYAGRGDLGRWLQAAATRVALNLMRGAGY